MSALAARRGRLLPVLAAIMAVGAAFAPASASASAASSGELTASAHGGALRVIDLGTLPQGVSGSEAVGINGHGTVTGWSDTKSGAMHAFTWHNGRMRDLGAPSGDWSIAWGINKRGDVVGEASGGSDDTVSRPRFAVSCVCRPTRSAARSLP